MKRERVWSAAGLTVLAAITIARVVLVDHLPDQGFFAKYLVFADRIVAGEFPRERLADFSPGYLWFLTALRAAGLDFHAIRTIQIVLVSVAAGFAAFAARRFGAVAVVVAPLLVLCSRAALVCATELEPETLILLLSAAALAVIVPPRDPEHRGRRDVVAGVLLGLSAICRPAAILVVLAVAGVLRSWKMIAAAAVPVIVVLAINLGLTGDATLMDPGTVFYEGMNPNAAGYEGVQPRIVNDLERLTNEPDYLHVAYRVVASRALGRPVTRGQSNRFWTAKAIAFATTYPGAALRLTVRKLLFAVHSYDAYDLATMVRKDLALRRWPLFLPFGVLVAFAAAAVLMRSRGTAPLVAFALASGVVLVAFYVTARQRNALVPALAVLAAAAIAEMVVARRWGVALLAPIVAVLLSIAGPPQHEDAYGWQASFESAALEAEATRALNQGDRLNASSLAASASILRTANEPMVSAGDLHDIATQTPRDAPEPARFDAAIALEKAGAWSEADELLASLGSYQPRRENRAVSSVAYYRARAALHLGHDAAPYLGRANADAPGDAHVLALAAVLGDARADQRLDRLHDPFTRDEALARAWIDAGKTPRALALRDRLLRVFPEWYRPRTIE